MKRLLSLFYVATLLAFLGKSVLPLNSALIHTTSADQEHQDKFNTCFSSTGILLTNQGERIVLLIGNAVKQIPGAFLPFLPLQSPNEFYFSNKIYAYSQVKASVGLKYRKAIPVFPTHYFW